MERNFANPWLIVTAAKAESQINGDGDDYIEYRDLFRQWISR